MDNLHCIQPLTNENFLVWKFQMKAYLEFNDCLGHIDGTAVEPAADSPDLANYNKCKQG